MTKRGNVAYIVLKNDVGDSHTLAIGVVRGDPNGLDCTTGREYLLDFVLGGLPVHVFDVDFATLCHSSFSVKLSGGV